MFYSVVNQRGERRSPYTMCNHLANRLLRECSPYFEGEQFEVESSEEMDKWPEIDDNGQLA